MNEKLYQSFWKADGKQFVGLIFGLIGCFICWGNHHYGFLGWRVVSGTPGFVSGGLSLAFMIVLYARKLIYFRSGFMKVLCFIIDVTIFATIFALFFHNGFTFYLIIVTAICFALLLFGSKGLAKLSVILGLLFWCLGRANVIERALGFAGFVAVLLIAACFYLQESFQWSELVSNTRNIKIKAESETKSVIDEASNDAKKMSKKAAAQISGIPIDKSDSWSSIK
ncbi:MAG: hypothetical protein MJ000_05295 [Bacteroidales bacterium]|nr:hypothetical protein [Bacteroidales bacterium]